MSATRYVPASAIISIDSSSISDPCSIDRTPARTARLIPSAPCACAATYVPDSAVSSTAARSSSSVNSGAPGFVPLVSTAPVAMILMKSAPYRRMFRTFERIWSTPEVTPNRSSRGITESTSTASPVRSPPPPGHVTYAPAQRIRGPSTSPASIASRNATSTNARNVPMSRTVVKPAMIVLRALRTPPNASWAPERITSDA